MSREYDKEVIAKKVKLLIYINNMGLFDIFSGIFDNYQVSISDMQRELGYKSPGHIYADLTDLESRGYITHDDRRGTYTITGSGKEKIAFYLRMQFVAIVLIFFGAGVFPILLTEEFGGSYLLVLGLVCIVSGFAIILLLWNLGRETNVL